jgi:hypothetical protein
VVVSPSDRFHGGLSREPTSVVVHQNLAAGSLLHPPSRHATSAANRAGAGKGTEAHQKGEAGDYESPPRLGDYAPTGIAPLMKADLLAVAALPDRPPFLQPSPGAGEAAQGRGKEGLGVCTGSVLPIVGFCVYHSEDNYPNLFAHRFSAPNVAGSREPLPVEAEACPMPSHHYSWRNENERLVPARPEPTEANPERLVNGRESTMGAFGVPHQQLLADGQVFEDKILARAEDDDDDPTDQVPEEGDRGLGILSKLSTGKLGSHSFHKHWKFEEAQLTRRSHGPPSSRCAKSKSISPAR